MTKMISVTEAARILGRKGGIAKSKIKRQTAIENGKKGGRPKKAAPDQSEQITKQN